MNKPRSRFAAFTSALTRPIDRNPFAALAVLASAFLIVGCGAFDMLAGRAADPATGKTATAAELERTGRAATREKMNARDDALAQAARLIEQAKAHDQDAAAVAQDYADAIATADANTERNRAAFESIANIATAGLGPVGAIVPALIGAGFVIDNRRKDRLIGTYRRSQTSTPGSGAPSA